MKRSVKVGLYGLTVADVIIRVNNISLAMNGNTNFPMCNPSLMDYDVAIDNLSKAQHLVESVGGKNNTTLRNVALKSVRELTGQMATYVNNVGNGNEVVLLSSGFPLRNLPSPVGKLLPPEGCKVTTEGQKAGEVKFYHKGRKKNKAYLYQVRKYVDGMSGEVGWDPEVTTTERSHVFSGLESGERYQFRVAVFSSEGIGDWSQLLMLRPQ
ncbi:MAG: fibronectin type III domain-containing protein [Flavobacteriales bacterium]|nr:fibronectin type III domain-containing protein [Flavobacteriales bacterium]